VAGNLDTYLKYTGQVDDEGFKLSANTETSGRYHTNWLNMMYPRLKLARNLLRDDGVIFVSIDDHEVQNLRQIMDEIFGPENFIATAIWEKADSPRNSARLFSEDHDYVLVYSRDSAWTPNRLPRTWDADFDTMEQDLVEAIDNIKADRSEDDVLYELLFKYGLDLAIPAEVRTIEGRKVTVIGAGALVVCLADDVSLEVVSGIAALKAELSPEVMRVVFLDSGFKDDVAKTNAAQILKQACIDDVKSL